MISPQKCLFLLSILLWFVTPKALAQKESPLPYQISVQHFVFEGNTVFSSAKLTALLSDYVGKKLTIYKIHEAKEVITKFYIAHGYVNSGVILPDQKVTDGFIRFKVIEGKLSSIKLKNSTRLHPNYIKGRIRQYSKSPLHLPSMQLPLFFLQNDPSIKTIHADLAPGKGLGESELNLEVIENNPFSLSLQCDNHKSPNIGDLHQSLHFESRDLSGWNETFGINYGMTEGLDDYGGYFSVPINYSDTRLSINYDHSASSVINDVFRELDIESVSETFSVGLRHPLWRTRASELAISVGLSLKKNTSTLLGFPYQYTAELEDGISRTTVLSLGQEWINRSSKHAFTLRSTFDLGINSFNATIVDHPADGTFVSWLGQIQWLRRLPFLHSQLLFKANLRLTDDELPPSEKFAVGGYSSVRGYRENSLTADQGFTTSLELQMLVTNVKFPGLSDGPEDGDIYLIPFVDFGQNWNKEEYERPVEDIASAGLGVRWLLNRRSVLELFWGHPFRRLIVDHTHSLQDDGIHFKLNLSF